MSHVPLGTAEQNASSGPACFPQLRAKVIASAVQPRLSQASSRENDPQRGFAFSEPVTCPSPGVGEASRARSALPAPAAPTDPDPNATLFGIEQDEDLIVGEPENVPLLCEYLDRRDIHIDKPSVTFSCRRASPSTSRRRSASAEPGP